MRSSRLLRVCAPAAALSIAVLCPLLRATPPSGIHLQPLGTYSSGVFANSGAEIAAYDAASKRLFSTNVENAAVDVIDIHDPAAPTLLFSIDVTPYGSHPNSVDVSDGYVAVAVEADDKTDPGKVVFFDAAGAFVSAVTVGALPDMVTFTPNGRFLLVANEGEPNDAYTVDPEGSVSVVRLDGGVGALSQADVRTATFAAFDGATLDPSVRVYGPNATASQDFEPEYIAVSHDSRSAYVTLQENNAIAVVDIPDALVTRVVGLGFKDHRLAENALDASDRDGPSINIRNWPVYGIYEPDAIASYEVRGQTYLVTANEGDTRAYSGLNEESRVGSLVLDPSAFPDGPTLKQNANLGRLTVTNALGDADHDGDFDALYIPGARSFAIWNETGGLVYESGSQFERITAGALPANFNATNDANDFDTRSDNKGPEPEGVAVASIHGRVYAFVALERVGGVMVYDVSEPTAPDFVQYLNNRDFSGSPAAGTAGDLGSEGLFVVKAEESPTGEPLLVVSNEISGTITVYRIAPV